VEQALFNPKMLLKDKKGQLNQVWIVSALVFAVASLVIALIIAFSMTSAVGNADLLSSNRAVTTVYNEVGWINETPYTLAQVANERVNYVVIQALNYSDDGVIGAGNYTLTSAGVITNASETVWDNVSFNYTYETYTNEELSSSLMRSNFSSGIDNVSAKIPTVFIILGVILILSIIIVLVYVWRKIGYGNAAAQI